MTDLHSDDSVFELTDELLGAYADGELDHASVSKVEAALRDDERARRRLADIRYVSGLTRSVARTPMPSDSAAPGPRISPGPTYRSDVPRYAIAAGAGALLAAGFMWFGSTFDRPEPGWVDSAIIYHRQLLRTVRDTRRVPLDIRGADPTQIFTRFERTLSFQPKIPDLSAGGFSLQGARLIATPDGWMLYVSYKSADGFIGLTAVGDEQPVPEETIEAGSVKLISWEQDDIAYSVAGTIDEEALAEISLKAQTAIEM